MITIKLGDLLAKIEYQNAIRIYKTNYYVWSSSDEKLIYETISFDGTDNLDDFLDCDVIGLTIEKCFIHIAIYKKEEK